MKVNPILKDILEATNKIQTMVEQLDERLMLTPSELIEDAKNVINRTFTAVKQRPINWEIVKTLLTGRGTHLFEELKENFRQLEMATKFANSQLMLFPQIFEVQEELETLISQVPFPSHLKDEMKEVEEMVELWSYLVESKRDSYLSLLESIPGNPYLKSIEDEGGLHRLMNDSKDREVLNYEECRPFPDAWTSSTFSQNIKL